MGSDTITLNKERKVTLTPFIIGANKPTVLICPGGGYTECSVNEGAPVANEFNTFGFNAFVLCYSVGNNYKWPYPLDDFEAAMEYIKKHERELSIDTQHIIAVGFSAGGHLVSLAASVAKNRPYAAIILYGATKASTISYTAVGAPDSVDAVNMSTCPCFLATSRNDWIVPLNNTLDFIDKLNDNFIDYELHVYGYSMHGFSIGKKVGAEPPLFCSRVGDWVAESVSWIDDLISERYISIRESADYADKYERTLSTRNSCGRIFGNDEAKKLIKRKFFAQYLIYEATRKKVGSFIDNVALKSTLSFLKVKDDIIRKMDDALSALTTDKED